MADEDDDQIVIGVPAADTPSPEVPSEEKDTSEWPVHKPLQIKARRVNPKTATDEELRTLFKWNPYADQQRKRFDEPEPAPALHPEQAGPTALTPPPRSSRVGGADSFQPSWSKPAKTQGTSLDAEVVRIIDGDTIRVKLPDGRETNVRIRGYDSPESPFQAGENSREALANMLGDGKIKLFDVREGEDKFGRTIATVGVGDNPDITGRMISDGHAVRPPGASEEGPRGNDWRNIRQTLPPAARAQSYDLADKQKKYGLLIRRGRLNPANPEYLRFREEMDEFIETYVKGYRSKRGQSTGGAENPVTRAVDKMIATRKPVDQAPGWEEAGANQSKPHGVAEWTAWGKTLNPAEKALWQKLQAADDYYNAKAPAYRKREYFSQPQYLEHRRLYDKFLHLTTERFRKIQQNAPPPERGRRRRRRAELSDDLQNALA